MISDILSDALDSIEVYQAGFPNYYDDFLDQIEEAKLAMTRLLSLLDTPPGTTDEMWAEGMARLGEADAMRLQGLMAYKVYHVRRQQVVQSLGTDHPMLVRLLKAEEAGADREEELAEALEAYTDPTHPEYDTDFDREIRALRPDWFEGEERA